MNKTESYWITIWEQFDQNKIFHLMAYRTDRIENQKFILIIKDKSGHELLNHTFSCGTFGRLVNAFLRELFP